MFKRAVKCLSQATLLCVQRKNSLPTDHRPLLVLRSPRTRRSLGVEQTWTHKSKASYLRRGFLPGRVLTMRRLIYDLFTGSTNHDEALNPLFSGPIPFSLGERGEKKKMRASEWASEREKKKKRATLNALQHMNIAIINSELWLGPSVSLNGPIRVNHCCLQASLGTHW